MSDLDPDAVLDPQGEMFTETLANVSAPHRCTFCCRYGADRRVEANPPDDSTQVFRFFCNSGCQANWETNQTKRERA